MAIENDGNASKVYIKRSPFRCQPLSRRKEQTANMFSPIVPLFFLLLPLASCMPQFLARIPNGGASVIPNSGLTCLALGHEQCIPGAPRNSFGLDFKAAEFRWTLALCQKDSDGDGLTNGEELGDPCCEWTEVNKIPLRTIFLSHPGDKDENGAKDGPKCRSMSGQGPETTPPTTTTPVTSGPRLTTTMPPTTRSPTTARPPPTTRRRMMTRAPPTTRSRTTTRAPRTTMRRTTARAPRTTMRRMTTRAPRTTRRRTTTKAPRTTMRRMTTRAPRTTRRRTTTRAPRTTRRRTTTRAPRTTRSRGMSTTSSDMSATTFPSESLMATPSPDEMFGLMPSPTESSTPTPLAPANQSESPFPMFSLEPTEEDRIPDPLGSCTLRKDRLTVACVCFASLNKDIKMLISRADVVSRCVDLFDSKDNIRRLGFACDKFRENGELEEDKVRRRINVVDMCLES
ncbi:unnamed protein product [Chondrus crispus]|uniref:Temptin Cys/Cys disulfide domain-containing protein n=1 Tax=Chondrus crispus TaxID=2769 RepID=R7QAH3_CHOCR|nr:unnamed protein product [Chondrus crispus]CDF34426.1 unnamed protein product [Chondrus crispus]|eukprot:XP_005714245.1 unnamed protein product [Chondrus crispus]